MHPIDADSPSYIPRLGKPQKKTPLMARPLRGGGGKGRAIKEKITFWNFLFYFVFKNKNYFTLDNLSKYGHIMLKFVGTKMLFNVPIFLS